MPSLIRFTLLLGTLACSCSVGAIEQRSRTDTNTNLITWTLLEQGFELEFTQQLPDLVRAFFLGRGFSKEVANNIGLSCSFQVVAKNASMPNAGNSIDIDLTQWKITGPNGTQGVKLKERWIEEWSDTKVSSASRVAFRWATFPTRQNFDPVGDFGWGMVTMGLPPDTEFDLTITWQRDGEQQQHRVKQMRCAKDR